jgi:hypothetical protein
VQNPFPHSIPRGPIVQKIKLTTVPNRKVYSLGEPVIFTVSIENLQAIPIVLTPDPPTIEIILRDTSTGQDEIVETFAPGTGQARLEPAGKVTYTLVWDQRNSHGEQVPPGYYILYIQATKDIKVDGDEECEVKTAFGILIQPPPEPGEKVLQLNQSQTAKGSIFTLERIELNPAGTKVYASLKPAAPGIIVRLFEAEAEYSIDAGSLKKADKSEILFHEFHLWNLDPVPGDAQELNFNILRYGERVLDKVEGPWEFTISLDSDNGTDQDVTFPELISQADKYDGRGVTLEAFYFFHESDINALADSVAPAPSGEGKVVPVGTIIRVRGQLYRGLLNQLYSQDPLPGMSPHYTIHFGKVRMTGKFETGVKEGDPGAPEYQITVISAEVLEWTPPPEGTLASSGNLRIKIQEFSSKPLQGVEVVSTRQPDGQPELSGLTDAEGMATFNDIKQGSYTFAANRIDYSEMGMKVTVTGGRTNSFSFHMARVGEAPDDFVPTPGYGPAYRANVLAGEVLNPWPPIQGATVTAGAPSDTVEITYRDYIETEAGQTRNNLFLIRLLDVDPAIQHDAIEVTLKGVELSSGITATQDWQQRGPYYMTVLKIGISPEVQPGEYIFNISVAINGKDYGTVPCTMVVLEQ